MRLVFLLSLLYITKVYCQCTAGSSAATTYLQGTTSWTAAGLATSGAVTVPAGTKVKLDQSLVLTSLTVKGELYFDLQDISITTSFIEIDGGTFAIGSTACRYNNKAIITITGSMPSDRPSVEAQPGFKYFRVVNSGKLFLYGYHPNLAWTKLSASFNKGEDTITVVDTLGWKVGNEVVVASSDFNAQQAEIFSITQVVDSKTYKLNSTAVYTHWGGLDKYIDERAEVALLSRPIVIQGDMQSLTQGFGAHFMIAPTFANAHIEGVEFKRMGQKSVLGKYPIHFHMAGEVTSRNPKVLFNVVHSSFQRCVVIHATNGLQVADNVCLRSVGHGYFIEDGIETGNTIERNIAIDIRAGALLPSDSEASCFWITNPNNTIRYNVAAGGINNCFWYALPEHPLGPSAAGNENYWNRRIPMGIFLNNTAHSCGSDGLHVDRGPRADNTLSTGTYSPLTVPTNASSPASKAIFENFTAYKCRNRGTWFRGGRLELKNALFADNAIGCTFAHGGGAYQNLEGAIVIGETQNVGSPESWESKGLYGRSLPKYSPWPIRGVEFYDGPVVFKDVKFYNFKSDEIRPAGGFSVLRQDEFSIITTNQLQGATFHNSVQNRVYYPEVWNDGDKNQVFKDVYGSIAGTPAWIVTNLDFHKTPACDTRDNMKAAICSTSQHNYVRLGVINYVASSQTYRKDMNAKSLIGLIVTRDNATMGYPQQHLWGDPVDADIRDSWGVTMLTKQRYILGFNQVTPKDMRIYMQYGNISDYVVLGIRYPTGTVFDCASCTLQANWYPDMKPNKVNTLAEVENGDGKNRGNFVEISSTVPRAWDDYTGSNGQPVIYIVPQFPGSQDLSQCPVGLAEDFPTYWNNEKCANSQNVDNQCPGLPYCAGHGYCNSGSSSCICDAGWKGDYCKQADCSVLFPTCNGHGTCGSNGKCTCTSSWYGNDCSKGNTCPNNCSGKGTCVNGKFPRNFAEISATCVCNANYGGSDCGTYYMIKSPSSWKFLTPNGYQQPWPCCPEYPFTITFPNISTFFNKTSFDDSSWPSSSSPFYYGTTPPIPGTVLQDNCNTWNCDDSYYFRKTFALSASDVSVMQSAVIHVASDNGADVYINGVLVDKDGDDHDYRYWNRELEVPTSVFVTGTNVIAVFLSNQDWSTDAYFDLELTYRTDKPCAGVSCASNENCVLGNCRCIDGYIPNSEGQCLAPESLQCTPNCNGRTCGDDGCGGSCGSCTGSSSCVSGSCVCQRNCNGKQCGSDGCGGTCGTCSGSQSCSGSQQCVCVPSCSGKVCGDDGCGGTCGTCAAGQTCKVGGTCVSTCTPSCTGKQCGNDGCGGSCGTCTGGKLCNTNETCACVANCIGASCGSDGCGGICGTCSMGYACNSTSRACVFSCVPDCNGRQCGNDGCGGTCGTCTGTLSCVDSKCVSNVNPCDGVACADPNAICDSRFGSCVCKDDFISIGGGPCTSRLQNKCADITCPDVNMVCTSGVCECTNGYTDALQTTCKACADGDVQVCYVSNGKGTKTCKSGVFEACVATECDAGHVLQNGLCDATTCTPGQVASCTVDNGLGQKTCPTTFIFSECTVTYCNFGYVQQENTCVDPALIAKESENGTGNSAMPLSIGVLSGIIAGAVALILITVVAIILIKKRRSASWY